ncbi:glycosyltransferase family 2 protein [Rhabdothermincola salaria]|uniref:glycosyltransferase family 2 protein n=1 Tax=Rhabdothermincola salaria TaxID=2903142 RepID=UPI001E3DC559|nr:glycosyltransferase family 2 protein [Rhabdothermincola salaria]
MTVVIPVRDGAATIATQLDALAAQTTRCRWEVVVADNGSTDATVAVVAAHPLGHRVPVRVVDAGPVPGSNRARNAGAAAARGRILAYCDADDAVTPGWLDAHWRTLRHGPDRIAAGPLDPTALSGPRSRRWQFALPAPAEGANGFVYGWGANLALPRALWGRLGGFREDIHAVGFEEVDLQGCAHEAGVAFVWVDDARVDYRLTPTVGGLLAKTFLHGRGLVGFARRHPGLVADDIRLAAALRAACRTAAAAGVHLVRGDDPRPAVRHVAYLAGVATEVTATSPPAERLRRLTRR